MSEADKVWLFVPEDTVPDRWRDRVVPGSMVPLFPEEAKAFLAGSPMGPPIDHRDRDLVRLTARGRSITLIASDLNMPLRTVERRLAALRQRFGVGSHAELAAFLAERGF